MYNLLESSFFRALVVFVLLVSGGYYSGEYLMGDLNQPFLLTVLVGILANSFFVSIFVLLYVIFDSNGD